MNNVPSCCYSILGAWLIVGLVLLMGFINAARHAPVRNDWD